MADDRVSISPRVVVAGVENGKVRVTLSLMMTKAGAASVSLANWPNEIETRLKEKKIELFVARPVMSSGRPGAPEAKDEYRVKPAAVTVRRGMVNPRQTAFPDPLIGNVTALWQWVMGKEATGAADLFVRIKSVVEGGDGNKSHEWPVVATRRSEAALYHTVSRACSVFRPEPQGKPDISQKKNVKPEDRPREELDPGVQRVVNESRQRGDSQKDVRGKYLAKTNLVEALDSLDPTNMVPVADKPETVIAAAITGDFSKDVAATYRNLHIAATAPDDPQAPPKDGVTRPTPDPKKPLPDPAKLLTDPAFSRAQQLLFALRSQPTLGRLFRFVVDLDVDAADFIDALNASGTSAQADQFALVTARLHADVQPVWSVVKLRLNGSTLVDAWPALRVDMDLAADNTPAADEARKRARETARDLAVSQRDGLVRLDQGFGDRSRPRQRQARFDLVTIDPALVVEGDVRRARKRQDLVDAVRDDEGNIPKEVDPVAIAQVPSPALFTAGLGIYDNWRQGAVAAEMKTSEVFCLDCVAKPTIVDAEDLATGFAVHLAAPLNNGMQFRSQMERAIDYALPEGCPVKFKLDAALAHLDLARGSASRRMSDAASVVSSARNRQGTDDLFVHVEERLVCMEGDPLALSCKKFGIEVSAGADLAIDRTYSLPTSGNNRPPPLRLGWPYRVAVGVQWIGGISPSAKHVAERAAADPELALPADRPQRLPALAAPFEPVRRFLRHEPIHAPELLLPEYIAKRTDPYRARQTGPVVTLRENVAQDASTWRVLLPPSLGLDDVWRHGVFDGDPPPKKRELDANGNLAPPRDAFREIDIDQPWGGFPAYGRKTAIGSHRGEPLPAGHERKGLEELQTPGTVKKGELAPPPSDPGQPVFRALKAGQTRFRPYYPDPAADELVIALRPAAAEEKDGVRSQATTPYFAGAPVVVPIRRANADFRDALPVAIEFVRKDEVRSAQPKQEDFFVRFNGKLYEERFADGNKLTKIKKGAGKALVLTIELYQGEHIAVDCWFAPTEDRLRQLFDIPETIATLTDNLVDETTALAAIEQALNLNAGAMSSLPKPKGRDRYWVTSAGLPVRWRIVAAAAACFAKELRRKPIPQLAAVRTIDAVHAVKEAREPYFDTPLSTGKVLALTRYNVELDQARGQDDTANGQVRRDLLSAWTKEAPDKWRERIKPKDTGVLLAGSIKIDRDTTSRIDVVARCASPLVSKIDDPQRRRTERQRIEGIWPKVPVKVIAGELAARETRFENAYEIYGFHVAKDGRVGLIRGETTILELDGIASWKPDSLFVGLETLGLAAEQIHALSAKDRKPPPTQPAEDSLRILLYDPFKDGLARRLRLALRATARHLPLFEEWPDENTGLPAEVRSRKPAPVDDDDKKDSEIIWVPATERPAPPAVDSVMPAFRHETHKEDQPPGCITLRRTMSLRVWLARPWFSSGEGERLGVVLWPPKLLSADKNETLAGIVPRADPFGNAIYSAAEAKMALGDFTDDDLGPGGKFVTRWGADPVRKANAPEGPFIGPDAFMDFAGSKLCEDPKNGCPGYVSNVPIPIISTESETGKSKASTDPPPPMLMADLLTFEPRFDLDTERWYVDVAIDAGSPVELVEPFVRLGLVRYQAHAVVVTGSNGFDLRASAPVAAWAQILPKREVHVWKETSRKAVATLRVQVSGPMAVRLGTDGKDREPQLRAALLVRTPLNGVQATEAAAQPANADAAGWRVLPRGAADPRTGVTGGAWSDTLALPPHTATQKLFVLIEELENYDSTANIDGSGESPRMESGPRFAAKIEIE
jgi:hypothetical protein